MNPMFKEIDSTFIQSSLSNYFKLNYIDHDNHIEIRPNSEDYNWLSTWLFNDTTFNLCPLHAQSLSQIKTLNLNELRDIVDILLRNFILEPQKNLIEPDLNLMFYTHDHGRYCLYFIDVKIKKAIIRFEQFGNDLVTRMTDLFEMIEGIQAKTFDWNTGLDQWLKRISLKLAQSNPLDLTTHKHHSEDLWINHLAHVIIQLVKKTKINIEFPNQFDLFNTNLNGLLSLNKTSEQFKFNQLIDQFNQFIQAIEQEQNRVAQSEIVAQLHRQGWLVQYLSAHMNKPFETLSLTLKSSLKHDLGLDSHHDAFIELLIDDLAAKRGTCSGQK